MPSVGINDALPLITSRLSTYFEVGISRILESCAPRDFLDQTKFTASVRDLEESLENDRDFPRSRRFLIVLWRSPEISAIAPRLTPKTYLLSSKDPQRAAWAKTKTKRAWTPPILTFRSPATPQGGEYEQEGEDERIGFEGVSGGPGRTPLLDIVWEPNLVQEAPGFHESAATSNLHPTTTSAGLLALCLHSPSAQLPHRGLCNLLASACTHACARVQAIKGGQSRWVKVDAIKSHGSSRNHLF
ncbi:hypothetical protein B0H11DRAFT_1932973 [Mycena galericulata]|nr:hypothetical protein B0H11DRAFT_1932973 [Mycena galericulata]